MVRRRLDLKTPDEAFEGFRATLLAGTDVEQRLFALATRPEDLAALAITGCAELWVISPIEEGPVLGASIHVYDRVVVTHPSLLFPGIPVTRRERSERIRGTVYQIPTCDNEQRPLAYTMETDLGFQPPNTERVLLWAVSAEGDEEQKGVLHEVVAASIASAQTRDAQRIVIHTPLKPERAALAEDVLRAIYHGIRQPVPVTVDVRRPDLELPKTIQRIGWEVSVPKAAAPAPTE